MKYSLVGLLCLVVCRADFFPVVADDANLSLLVSHVGQTALKADFVAPNLRLPNDGEATTLQQPFSSPVLSPRRESAATERRRQFEAEFGIHDESLSLLKRQLVSLKYGVDTVLFAADMFLSDIEDSLVWRRTEGGWQRVAVEKSPHRLADDPPHTAIIHEARVKFDVEFRNGGPYVGLRLVMPWGD